jgi:hypothetical protein
MKEHPFQSVFTAASTGILSTAYAFRPDWHGIWFLGLAVLIFLAISVTCFERKEKIPPKIQIITLLLVLSIATPSNAQLLVEEPPVAEELGGSGGGGVTDPQCGAGGVVAVLVLCAGAYCVYKLIKFCQKKFPRTAKNKEEDSFTFNPDGSPDTDAAAFNYGEMGSCGPCDDELAASLTGGNPDPHVNFILDLEVSVNEEDDVILRPALSTDRTPESLITFLEFAKEVQEEHAVKITGTSGSEYFSHNGIPIPKEEAAIQFDPNRRAVKVANGDYSVVVERSFDLQTWETVLHTEVNPGAVVRMVDTTRTGQAFYRYSGFRSD